MKRVLRIMTITTVLFVLISAAFIGGMFAGPWYVEYRSPVTISEAIILMNPPVDGSIFRSEVYEDLNVKLEEFLKGEKVMREYPGIKPHYIVVPSPRGYTRYYWLEDKEKSFPPQLSEECNAFAHEVLWGFPIHGGKHTKQAEQTSADQPATAPESKSEGSDKPQPEAEGRSR